jgi:hypothetical protein
MKAPGFLDNHHYFDWCSLLVKLWQKKVQANPKTKAVNEKLDLWHRQNPSDGPVVNLAAVRMERARRKRLEKVRKITDRWNVRSN